MQEKKAVARQVRSRYQKAGRKEKSAILDEFIKTTGYKNRKYALRALNKPQTAEALIVVKGKAVKLRPPKKDPPPDPVPPVLFLCSLFHIFHVSYLHKLC
jgi:hypothetical protein